MKKVLSGILALMLAGSLTLPAFAADITATEVKINDEAVDLKTEPLKADAGNEEGMLRISQSTLLKIKLKLEGENTEGKSMSFMANQKLADGESISKEKIQFIDEKTISADGTVIIQFRPRENQGIGIYNMRANTKGATMFSKFYKTVADQIQPSLSDTNDTPKKNDISITVSGYTEAWKNVTKLWEVKGDTETEIPASDYTIEATELTPQIATLKIKTTGDWATQGQHTFRFVSTDVAYNPITFTANITEPEKVTSGITSKFVSANKPEGLTGTTTLPSDATEGNPVEFTVTAPKGYDVANIACQADGSDSVAVTEADGKYSFTMPDKAVNVTVTVVPIEYTINFNLDGGEGSDTPIKGSVEALPTLPADPTKDGHTFVGWFVPTENGGRRRITQDIINDSFATMLDLFDAQHMLTLTANYTENGKYEVVYQAPYAENKPTGGNYDAVENPTITISQQEPQRTGYTFIGWKIEGDETNTIYKHDGENKTYDVPKDTAVVTFIAQWEMVTYTITLQNGEESSVIRGTVESLPVLTIPTKDGYEFKGWFTEETGGEKIDAITAINIAGLTTLYARWEEIQTDDYEIVSIDEANSKVKVIKRTDNTNSAYIIVATYSTNGNLVKASIKDISDVQTNVAGTDVDVAGALEGEYATVQVFMWNTLSDMRPRCAALPKSE